MANFNSGFEDRDDRRSFVIRVYFLILLQMVLSISAQFVCYYVEPIKEFLKDDWIVLIACLVISLLGDAGLQYVRVLRTQVPTNYLILSIVSLCIGGMAGVFAVRLKTLILAAALVITFAIILLLTLLSMSPCFDLAGWMAYLVTVVLIVLVAGIGVVLFKFVLDVEFLFVIYGGLIAVVFVFFVVLATQLIMGNSKYDVAPEEHTLGCVTIHVDILAIYPMISALMSSNN